MAQDDNKDTKKPPAHRPMGQPGQAQPDVSVGRGVGIGTELGMPLPKGQTKPSVEREPDSGRSVVLDGQTAALSEANKGGERDVELDKDGKPVADKDAPAEEAEGADKGADKETPAEGDEKVEAPEKVEALPAWDAEKPEVVEAYGKRYLNKDGKFDMAALSADWQANAKLDAKGNVEGGLSEGTYAFLETKGISKEMVKSVEQAQMARLTLDRQSVFTQAGGEERYKAAVEWAKEKGYNDEGKAEFNAALDAGGAKRADAVDLLMQRYDKANPAPRRKSPAKTAADASNPGGGQGGGDGGAKPYDTYAEYQADLRKAQAEGNQALLDENRARLKASPWYGSKNK